MYKLIAINFTFSAWFLTRIHCESVLSALCIKGWLGGLGRGSPKALLPQGGLDVKPFWVLKSLQISVLDVVIYDFLSLKRIRRTLL